MKPAKLKLPSFAAFKRMTVLQRTAIFTRWVKSKPASRTYDYWNEKNCPLARFGQAITRSRSAEGGGTDFWYGNQWYAVFGRYTHVVASSGHTYGGILRRLTS